MVGRSIHCQLFPGDFKLVNASPLRTSPFLRNGILRLDGKTRWADS